MKPKYSVIDVVPHGAPMSLLDDIERYSDHGLVATVTIRKDSMFCEDRGVPAWVGVEYMGQAIAAFAGVGARLTYQPVKIGFLVSTRRYESPCSYFEVGLALKVSVEQITDSTTGLRVFDCRITARDMEIKANLNVYMPENIEEFLKGEGA
jgi:predicted hotdog family 3-hydroxylacyl-ACP dehydratase